MLSLVQSSGCDISSILGGAIEISRRYTIMKVKEGAPHLRNSLFPFPILRFGATEVVVDLSALDAVRYPSFTLSRWSRHFNVVKRLAMAECDKGFRHVKRMS